MFFDIQNIFVMQISSGTVPIMLCVSYLSSQSIKELEMGGIEGERREERRKDMIRK